MMTATPPGSRGAARHVTVVGPSLHFLGGQAVQVRRLLRRLETVPSLVPAFLPINPTLPGPLAALHRVKYVRTVAAFVVYVASLVRRLPRTDVVHVFSPSYWAFLLGPAPAILAARAFGRRVLLNYHSGEADDHLTRWGWHAIPIMRLASQIVVPSQYLVDVFARHGLPATAVFNHLDVEQFPYRERRALRPRFLSNRNFEAHYNVACVLRAFGRIQQRHPEAQLVVAGDGRQRAALHALAAELGLRNVEFTGPVAPERMPALYDAADVYLNASSIDNMPLSILEAFATGVPVVTTDAGGIPYIVRHEENGLLVPCDDDAALAAGALRLLDDADLAASLAARARSECLAKYTWGAVQREWEACYAGTVPPGAQVA
jgi:glycosyltransferase involved in cell wall biosynthesis